MTETNISPKKFPKLFNSGKRRREGRYLVSSNIKAFAAPLPNSVSILIPLAFVRLFTRCLQYWLKAFLPQSVFGDCEQKDDGTPGPTHPPTHPTIRSGKHTNMVQHQDIMLQHQWHVAPNFLVICDISSGALDQEVSLPTTSDLKPLISYLVLEHWAIYCSV